MWLPYKKFGAEVSGAMLSGGLQNFSCLFACSKNSSNSLSPALVVCSRDSIVSLSSWFICLLFSRGLFFRYDLIAYVAAAADAVAEIRVLALLAMCVTIEFGLFLLSSFCSR